MPDNDHSDLVFAATEMRRLVRQLNETLACVEQSIGVAGAKLYMRQAVDLAADVHRGCQRTLRDVAEEEG